MQLTCSLQNQQNKPPYLDIQSRIFLLLLVPIVGLFGVLLLVHIARLLGVTNPFSFFDIPVAFAFFALGFAGSFLFFVGLEVAGGGRVVSLEGNCMESTSGWLEPHADLHMQLS